jgi:hypothetical protein
MADVKDLTAFLYEFYNYARHVKDQDPICSKTDIKDLAKSIEGKYDDSLYTKPWQSKKRSRSKADRADENRGPSRSSPTKKTQRAAIVDALQELHCQVYQDWSNSEEFEPFDKVIVGRVVLVAGLIEGCSFQITYWKQYGPTVNKSSQNLPADLPRNRLSFGSCRHRGLLITMSSPYSAPCRRV